MSVDLPHPFWPTSAWTSPGAISSVTSRSARVPPNVLDSRSSRSTGGGPAGCVSGAAIAASISLSIPLLRASRDDPGFRTTLFLN